jgi:hypothetical protein
MFLDCELKRIQEAKDNLAKRCAMRRMLLQLDTLAMRSKVRGVLSGLKTGLAIAELVRGLLSDRKNRDC